MADFGREIGRDPFIRIHKQHPLRLHQGQGGIALLGVIFKTGLGYLCPRLLRQRHCLILAERIKNQHRIRPTHAFKAGGNVLRFV